MNKQIQLHFFGKYILLFFTVIISVPCFSQTKPGTTFSGTNSKDPNVCAASSGNFMSETQVDDLITDMLSKIGTKNRYIIVNCTQVENCQAFLYKGRPYILYNPEFLGKVKKLSFSSSTLPAVTEKDWETLTILAHELGHHVNNHLSNPLPDAKQTDMELEADETAGFIIYLLGGTLKQSELAYNDVPEKGNYTHPGKQSRIDAVANGWRDAEKKYPRQATVMPKPVITNPVIKKTSEITITDIEGNNYNTVKIGTQVWLSENLNVSTYLNGDPIPQVTDPGEWSKLTTGAWCYFDNDSGNKTKYGKMYNWYAINDKRGLAPQGWHIPKSSEFQTLIDFLGGSKLAGAKLKDTTIWWGSWWSEKDRNSNNSSGFSAMPGTYRDEDGRFSRSELSEGHWWSISLNNIYNDVFPVFLYLYNTSAMSYMGTGQSKKYGRYIRCVKD